MALALLAAVLPVIAFLLGLLSLDSYQLVRPRSVALVVLSGALIASLAYLLNATLLGRGSGASPFYFRYEAPILEETLKALLVAWLIRSQRTGFLVDAAILGFALGTGFALFENLTYLASAAEIRIVVFIVRGFGTAIMHGAATALFAMVSKTLVERRGSTSIALFLPGLLLAVAVHSTFNHFFLSPVMTTLGVLIVLPLLLYVTFRRSEKALERWLGSGFDADTSLLDLIRSGRLSDSPAGRYLRTLRDRFPGETVVDMLCYLRLHTELSLRAKGELMMREAGFKSELEPEMREKLEEMRHLERSIGRTGRLAMAPLLHGGGRELWQLHLLREK